MAPMTKVKRKALDVALKELCEDLQVDEVSIHLISVGKLSDNDYELVKSKVTSADKVRELVRILKTKGDGAFDAFLEGLNETQGFLAETLKKHLEAVQRNGTEVMEVEDGEGIPLDQIDLPNELVTDQDLNKIAQGLGSDWKEVGRSLGLKQQQIHACEADNPHSLHDKIFDMLHKWKRKAKKGATRAAIVNNLAKAEVDPEAYEFLLVQ